MTSQYQQLYEYAQDIEDFYSTKYPQIDYDNSNFRNMQRLRDYLEEGLGLPAESTLEHFRIYMKKEPPNLDHDPFYLWMQTC